MHVMEHRWGQRVPVGQKVRLACRGHVAGAGILRDASISGAFVQTSLQPPLFSQLEIAIEVGGEIRGAPAWVVRRERGGIALEWSDLAPEAVVALLDECARRRRFKHAAPRAAAASPASARRGRSRALLHDPAQQAPEQIGPSDDPLPLSS